MTAKRSRRKCRHVFIFLVVLLAPAGAEAQTGGVTMKTMVSETVALSVLPNSISGDIVSTGNTVRITVSGADANAQVIRVPLLVRSNSSFKISAAVESNTAGVTQLSVTDVRATRINGERFHVNEARRRFRRQSGPGFARIERAIYAVKCSREQKIGIFVRLCQRVECFVFQFRRFPTAYAAIG